MKLNLKISGIIRIIMFIVFIISLVLIATDIFKISSYDKVDAIITESGTRDSFSSGSAKRVKYINFEYEYNGKTYSSSQNVTKLIGNFKGSKKTVYVNPDNPEKFIENRGICGNVILSITSLVLGIAFTKLERKKLSNE